MGHPAAELLVALGVLRKSTISVSSALASSMPATSSNVTMIFCGSTRRACERPKFPSPPSPPPPARIARRAMKQNTANSSRVGPKPTRSSVSSEVPGLGFLALTSTSSDFRSVRQLVGVPERRNLGREQRRRRRLRVVRRVAELLRERALDRAAPRGDRLDLARLELLEEVRAERDRDPWLRRRLGRSARQPVDREQPEEEQPEAAQGDAAASACAARASRGRRAPARPASRPCPAASARAGPTCRCPATALRKDSSRPSTLILAQSRAIARKHLRPGPLAR